MDQTQRARFYEGQTIGADDLAALEEFPRVQEARHALGAHTWGIAIGLDLVEKSLPSGEVEINLMPGYAWDGYGRPIVVLAPTKISPQKLVNYPGTTPPEGVLVKIWVRYLEAETKNAAPGFEVCGVADQHARVVETFAIEVGEAVPAPHDDVTIAGGLVDPLQAEKTFNAKAPQVFDESIPFQEFPEDDGPRWLIAIGYVRWLKQLNKPGRFVARNDTGAGSAPKDSDLARQFRQYIGVVAETLHAPGGVIRLRDRDKDPDPGKTYFHPPNAKDDPTNPNDLVWVEGSLRVQGDARVAGGRVEWRTKEGLDHDTPIAFRRHGDDGKTDDQVGGRRLQAVTGRTGQDPSRFAAGPVHDNGDMEERLTVMSNGHIGIRNEDPKLTLHVRTLTAIEEGDSGGSVWSSFGQNLYYDGSWNRIDSSKVGVNFHIAAQGSGTEFRFGRIEVSDTDPRNIAAIGSSKSYFESGKFGIGNVEPGAQVHIKSLTVIEEGEDAEGLWTTFGQNGYFNGSWLRLDDKKPGANLHMNPDGNGQEFRFQTIDKDGTNRQNIAVLGTDTSFVLKGRFGVGTSSPNATLDVDGRIMRKGQALTQVGTVGDGDQVPVPWGNTDDWNIFVAPFMMGWEFGASGEDAIAWIMCSAGANAGKNAFFVTAKYRQKDKSGHVGGQANYLLVPR